MLIDTHCHLEMGHYDEDRTETIKRALEAGVGRMLTVATNMADGEKVLKIASEHKQVFCALGIHPHDSPEAGTENLAELARRLAQPKALALGEIGLDFFKNYAPRDVQIRAFQLQLELADELDMPIIIHDRDAHEETVGILREQGKAPYRGVFHCFAGDVDIARQVLDLGFYLSFTGAITFKKETRSHEVLRMAPRDRVMIETDAPFLTPTPYRGKRNEPAYVRFVAEKLAELWGIPVDLVARITSDNAYRLFGFEAAIMEPAISYEWKESLYLNITNRCGNQCDFCAKWPDFCLGPHNLRLNAEPSVAEVLDAIGDPSSYPEIVFCGYGEPTERLGDLIEIAKNLKARGAKSIRLNTNGQADLINGRATAQDLKGVVDAVSVSLNSQDAKSYQELCSSKFGEKAYGSIKNYIKDVARFVPEVTASVVRLPGVDIEACRRIAEVELKVIFRVRG
jgi:TatD DNase family protein